MDLTPLTDWLATLGPWGVLAALVVGFLVPKLFEMVKKKWPGKTPAEPTNPAAPAPGGLLGGLLDAIRDRIRRANPKADADQVVAEVLARELVYGTAGMPPPAEPETRETPF